MSHRTARTRQGRPPSSDYLDRRRVFNASARVLADAFEQWLGANTLGDADRELLELDRLRLGRDRALKRLKALRPN